MFDLTFLASVAVLSIIFYLLLNNKSNYWKSQKVPHIPPIPVFGNLKSLLLLEKSVGDFLGDLYSAVEASNQRFVGIHLFNCAPAVLIRDPELIRRILVVDFQYFTEKSITCDEKNDPLGYHNVFVAGGSKWKFLRSKLTPTFTSSKIKQMSYMIKEVGERLMKFLEDKMEKNQKEEKESAVLEVKSFIAKFTTDVISLCAFGINSDCIFNDKSPFTHFSKFIFETSIKRAIDTRAFFFVPFFVKLCKILFMSKEATSFFRQVFHEILVERENNPVKRNDFVDILIKLKKEQEERLKNQTADEYDKMYALKGDLLLAQSTVFFTAGFETSSTVIGMCLYELALNPHIQNELRKEILESLSANEGQFTYENMSDMDYLDKVVSETLRMYPPMTFIERKCTTDYEIPDTKTVIKRGMRVYIPLYKGLHYDPDYFPMPEKFDPERFTKENKSTRHQFSYLPFGEGPRTCIGMRFGLTTVKTALCVILPKYEVQICEKSQIPLLMDNRSFLITAKGGIYLKFVKI